MFFFSGFLFLIGSKISYILYIFIFFFFFFFFLSVFIVEYDFFSFFFIDSLSYLMVLLTIYILCMMELAYLEGKLLMNLLNLLMMVFLILCFFSDSLVNMYFFFESSLFPLLMLIFLKGMSPERFVAGLYLLLFTLMGSFFFLVQLFFFFNMMSVFFSMLLLIMSNNGLMWGCMFVMFLVKYPVYGVHFWLPKAHVEASVTGSMILAGVMLKLGGYGMLRLMNLISILTMYDLIIMIMSLSLFGAFIISFSCLRQIDVKVLIAYSSISHLALVLSGVVSMYMWGVSGSVMLMISHGLCSSGMFYIANIFYMKFMTRNMMLMKGSFYYYYFMIYGWVIMLMINMGVPVSMNFFSEIMIVVSLLKFSFLNFVVISFLLILSVGYSLIMLMYLFHGHSWSNSVIINKEMVLNYLVIFLHMYMLMMYIFLAEFFLLY